MIYFDNAATTYPKPPQLKKAGEDYLTRYCANPGRAGHTMSMETAEQVFLVRQAVADFFHLPLAENVVFTQNCTQSLNTVLQGLLKWGDHVVISDLEHNSVLRPVYALWQKRGVQYTVAQTIEGDDDATVESFRRCLQPNTKLIACTHGSNAFGMKLPIARLAQLAHGVDALLLADCAQTAGVEDIDMAEMGIDFLAAPGHKSLYGPTGTGVLLVNSEVPLEPLTSGGTGSASLLYTQPDFLPDRLESGTINTAGILGLGAGLAEVNRLGTSAIRTHEITLAGMLYDGLAKLPEITLYTERPTARYHLPVVSFTLGTQHSEETSAQLSRHGVATRGGYHCAPLAHRKMATLERGTVRVSLGMYNSADEVREFLTILKFLQNG